MREGWLRRIPHILVETVYPRMCAVCGQRGTWLCATCSTVILPLQSEFCCNRCGHPRAGGCECAHMHPGIFRARAAVVYDGWPINAIHNFKYKFERGRADLLGEMMVDVARELDADLTLVPVPLHGDRQAMRGFNQARLLAERIARDTDSVVLDCLMRPKATEAQARSTREERIQQMENAFAPMPGWRADPGQHYVLVDDVYTTGATTNACAHALEEAGARWISVLTFAFDLQHREREAYRKSVTTGTIGQ